MDNNEKIIKFHGTKVANIIIDYTTRPYSKPIKEVIEEFDALKDPEICETINIQVVADYVTITFYKEESTNSIIRRELIPTHTVQHIWVKDSIQRQQGQQVQQKDKPKAVQVAEELQKEESELEQIKSDPERIQ